MVTDFEIDGVYSRKKATVFRKERPFRVYRSWKQQIP